jgi:glucokinase
MNLGLVVGIDIGGTKIAVGVADMEGRLLKTHRCKSHEERGPDPMVADAVSMVKKALEEVGGPKARPLFAGIACPGPLDQKKGIVLSTPNMTNWENYPVVARVEEALGIEARLENDANAAGLGEALYGAGSGKEFVAYFTVSTGVGGGFVENGKVLHGAQGNAAEFGHTVVVPVGGDICGCGGAGHVESYASGTAIQRRARERLRKGAQSLVRDLVDVDEVTTRELAIAARKRDPFALSCFEEAGFFLGLGIVNVIQMFNPNIVILGGGVTNVGSLLFKPVQRTVNERVMKDYQGSFTIEKAKLGDHVGVRGAIGVALNALAGKGKRQ